MINKVDKSITNIAKNGSVVLSTIKYNVNMWILIAILSIIINQGNYIPQDFIYNKNESWHIKPCYSFWDL